jgi:Mce-associated membrane protein
MPVGKARRAVNPPGEKALQGVAAIDADPMVQTPAAREEPAEAGAEAAQPEAAQPEAAQPEGTQREVTQPDEADVDAAELDAAEPDEAEPDEAEPDEAEADEADEADEAEHPADEAELSTRSVVFVERRPAGKRIKVAAVAAAVLFVAAGAFAGATVRPYLVDRALVETKVDIARTAVAAITTLWTYTPDNMEALPDRAHQYLGGDFENDYRKYIDGIAAANKQAQVSNNTQVLGAAVESVDSSDATAIVYTNSTSTSPATKDIPSLKYLSYRLTMERQGARWLVTKMSTITSLDLTPRL